MLTIFPQNESGRWEYAGKQKDGKRIRIVSMTRRIRMVCFSVSVKIIFFLDLTHLSASVLHLQHEHGKVITLLSITDKLLDGAYHMGDQVSG